MTVSKHSEAQIIAALKQVEAGRTAEDVARECGVSKHTDVLQLSELLAGDVKESRNGNPTRDLQMAADRSWPHTLCGPVVPSLFSFAARC